MKKLNKKTNRNIYNFLENHNNQKVYHSLKSKIKISKKFIDYSKVVIRKPWGYEYLIYQNDQIAITILYINKDQQTSFHCHPRKKTSLIVLDGIIKCRSLSEVVKRKIGESIFIDKKVFHQSSNISNQTCILMEIESPNMKQDILRYKDKYGRKEMGYEKSDKFSINLNNYNFISLSSEGTYHNVTKKFGKSSITFLKVKKQKDLLSIFVKYKEAIFSILEGSIILKNKKYLPGFTFDKNFFDVKKINFDISDQLSILVTKKNDELIKSSDLIIDTLINQNIDKAYIVPGDSNLHLIDSVGRRESFDYDVFNIETHAGYAALGYSKKNLKPSVIFASSGHSGLKLIETITAAYIDSEPLIVISGQALKGQNTYKNIRQLGNKSVDIINIVKSITKYSLKIRNEYEITYQLEKAIYLSKNNRPGPVWIDIPIDLLGKTLNEKKIKHFNISPILSKNFHNNINNKVKKIYQLIKESKKPALLIGYGVRLSNSQNEILKLINYLKIPVFTSRRGSDLIDAKNKYYYGRPGVYGNRYSNIIIQKSDLLISIGTRLSIPLVGRNSKDFAKNAIKVLVDVDLNELNKKTIKIDLKINCSADIFIKSMINQNLKVKSFKKWIEDCLFIKKAASFKKENYFHEININPYLFIKDLSNSIPDHTIIFMDGGAIMNYTMQSLDMKKNQRLITSSGLDNHGFSLLASLGLSNVDVQNFVIVLCDESTLYSSLESIHIIRKKNIPIKIFSFKKINNVALKNSQKDFFGRRYVATEDVDNFEGFLNNRILKRFSIKFLQIHKFYDKLLLNSIFANNDPMIISIKTDPNHKIIPKMGFKIDFEGNWYPRSLEDMFPFMDSKKLKDLLRDK